MKKTVLQATGIALTAGFLSVSSPVSYAEEGHKQPDKGTAGWGALMAVGTGLGGAGLIVGGLVAWGRKHDEKNAKIPRSRPAENKPG